MNKKALSLIATVLIMGFIIVLSAIIIQWGVILFNDNKDVWVNAPSINETKQLPGYCNWLIPSFFGDLRANISNNLFYREIKLVDVDNVKYDGCLGEKSINLSVNEIEEINKNIDNLTQKFYKLREFYLNEAYNCYKISNNEIYNQEYLDIYTTQISKKDEVYYCDKETCIRKEGDICLTFKR